MPEEVTSAMMYCRDNRELLHKYYAEIARERILRNKKLFCLHLKMKRMLNRKSMLEWIRTKRCEEEGSVFRVLYVFT